MVLGAWQETQPVCLALATGLVGGLFAAVPWPLKHVCSMRLLWLAGSGLKDCPLWHEVQGFLEAMFGGMGGGPTGLGAWQLWHVSLFRPTWLAGAGHHTSRPWQARQSPPPPP